jgi:hypothetical protein
LEAGVALVCGVIAVTISAFVSRGGRIDSFGSFKQFAAALRRARHQVMAVKVGNVITVKGRRNSRNVTWPQMQKAVFDHSGGMRIPMWFSIVARVA